MPKTLQDAVVVTCALGLEYLWIDALCIVQDDEIEKEKDIGDMGDIYSRATVTISASSSKRCQDGFLGPRCLPSLGESISPLVANLPLRTKRRKQASVTIVTDFEKSPVELLDSRAWTLQERALSRRILEFGQYQTRWVCLESGGNSKGKAQNDGWNQGLVPVNHLDTYTFSKIALAENRFGNTPVIKKLWRHINRTDVGGIHAKGIERAWILLIEDYSKRNLTDLRDHLRAVAGMASRCQPIIGGHYYAGLWEFKLIPGLLWESDHGAYFEHDYSRPSAYLAPSWSWAGIHMPIRHYGTLRSDLTSDAAFRVGKCELTLVNPRSPFGSLSAGSLTLTGRTRPVQWLFDKTKRNLRNGFPLVRSDGIGTTRLCIYFNNDAIENDFKDGTSNSMALELLLIGREVSTVETHHEVFGLCLRLLADGNYQRVGMFAAGPRFAPHEPKAEENWNTNAAEAARSHQEWLCAGDVKTVTIV